jgi:hypothetical protein
MSTDRSIDIARWLDGDMSPEEAKMFEADLDIDPALLAQIEAWQGNDAALRTAFVEQPVPDALVALVENHPAFRRDDNVVDFTAARAKRETAKPRGIDWRWVGAIAATLVVAVGVGSQTGVFAPTVDNPVLVALASTPSGTQVALAKSDRITPTLTVPVREGYCREFKLEGPAGPRDGLACRTGDEGWQLKQLIKGAAASGGDGYQQAGGEDHAAFDSVYRALGAGDPLDAAQEKAAITKRWKK